MLLPINKFHVDEQSWQGAMRLRLIRPQLSGADLIVEVGGAGTFNQSLQAVRFGGTVAQIGVLSQSDQPVPIPLILHRQIRVHGVYVGSRAHFEAMNRAITAHRTRPVVDRVFAFGEARDALRMMETGSHFGKIVIQVVA